MRNYDFVVAFMCDKLVNSLQSLRHDYSYYFPLYPLYIQREYCVCWYAVNKLINLTLKNIYIWNIKSIGYIIINSHKNYKNC